MARIPIDRMLRSAYIPHAIYSMAIVSLSIHLVNKRHLVSDERARATVHISALQSLSELLKAPNRDAKTQNEVDRLTKLANRYAEILKTNKDPEAEREIGWKEAAFGRKSTGQMSPWEQKELDEVLKELSKDS